MCFGSSKSQSTKPPEPTPSSRFEYNQPYGQDQQKKVAIASSMDPAAQASGAFGSDLGASQPKTY